MLHEDQYMERTPDLVAKVRALREAGEKEMNRFTRVADYDVRRVIGQKPQAAPVSDETATLSPAVERPKKSMTKSSTSQFSIEFVSAAAEPGDEGESS